MTRVHEIYTVLLYYKYTHISDPAAFASEHQALCQELGLTGRILIAEEGINGTVAGLPAVTEQYQAAMQADERFAGIQFKEHQETFDPFPNLKIKVRAEIVTLGTSGADPEHAGQHLSPQEWHEQAQDPNTVILDARNNFEWQIGKFKDAVTPDIEYFREFPDWVKAHKAELKNKKVLMYCTGGIRCERASAVLKEEGIDDVYQLNGGIINYGTQVPDGLWEGSCFVFDARMAVPVNDPEHHTVISTCRFCKTKTDRYYNCCNAECNKLILLCDVCLEGSNMACSEDCALKHRAGVVKHWDIATRQAVEGKRLS